MTYRNHLNVGDNQTEYAAYIDDNRHPRGLFGVSVTEEVVAQQSLPGRTADAENSGVASSSAKGCAAAKPARSESGLFARRGLDGTCESGERTFDGIVREQTAQHNRLLLPERGVEALGGHHVEVPLV